MRLAVAADIPVVPFPSAVDPGLRGGRGDWWRDWDRRDRPEFDKIRDTVPPINCDSLGRVVENAPVWSRDIADCRYCFLEAPFREY